MTPSEYWARYPYDEALAIVQAGFGQHYLQERAALYHNLARHHIRLVEIADCETTQYESSTRANLSQIGWQMIVISLLDKSRFKNARDKVENAAPTPTCNRYGLAPIVCLDPRPPTVYHATEKWRAEKIRLEGLKPNWAVIEYPDTEGKIHVCQTLDDGGKECAAYWAKLLSVRKGLSKTDYSILELNLESVPSARVYQDLHSVSGIVLDSIPVISATAIRRVFAFSGEVWTDR